MENYGCKITIAGPAGVIYYALTTASGIQGWWTKTCEVGERVGTLSIFRFGETYNVMQIEKLEPAIEVRWNCLEQYHHAPGKLTRSNEWVRTQVQFRLSSQTPNRTLLEFEHIGLTPRLESYAICERGWDHFLKRSLKNYIETGKGEPFA